MSEKTTLSAGGQNRRAFLGATAVGAVATALPVTRADAQATPRMGNTRALPESFQYEVVRSEEEWRDILSEEEFGILRENGTEPRFSSPLVSETRSGIYRCRGCDLTLYDALWKVQKGIGWVFFRHSHPDTILTSIDGVPFQDGIDVRDIVPIEAHCRRCGSHIGHLFNVEGELLHCLNGASLVFESAEA